MKKYLLLLSLFCAFAVSTRAFADSVDDQDSGWGNDSQTTVDDGSTHSGDEAR